MCLSTAIRIRPAVAADNAAFEGLEALIDAAFRSYSDCDNAGTAVAAVPEFAAEAPRTTSARRLVLEWSGTPLAALRWAPHAAPADAPGHAAIVDLFAVAEGFRTAGFARRLLAAAETDMRRAGCGSLEITAPLDALPALTRLGFRPIRPVQRALATGETCPAVLLGKAI